MALVSLEKRNCQASWTPEKDEKTMTWIGIVEPVQCILSYFTVDPLFTIYFFNCILFVKSFSNVFFMNLII
jgi:hypothetical protein